MIIAIDLPDEAATAALAERIAACVRVGDVIALRGDLGVGKTSFARAFIRAAVRTGEEVPSPTFTLVQVYEPAGSDDLKVRGLRIWHFDLYRLGHAEEVWELGIEEAFAEGVSLIEWPERLGALLPPDRLDIAFSFGEQPQARHAVCDGGRQWQTRLALFAAHA